MTKVLLGQSYYLHFDPKELEAMMPYPPLGTLYAASYMRERGYDVALFDAMLARQRAGMGRGARPAPPATSPSSTRTASII